MFQNICLILQFIWRLHGKNSLDFFNTLSVLQNISKKYLQYETPKRESGCEECFRLVKCLKLKIIK